MQKRRSVKRETRRRVMSPVGVALAANDLNKHMRMREIQLRMTAHGEDIAQALADIALPIGVACETLSFVEEGSEDNLLAHEGLLTIQDMCLNNDYRWDEGQADAVFDAIDVATRRMRDCIRAANFTLALEACRVFAKHVSSKTVQPGSVTKGAYA